MTIKAKFSGRCTQCGGEIKPGDQIEWTRGQGSRHTKCPVTDPAVQPAADAITVSRGSGYGGTPYQAGQTIKSRDNAWVVVERAGETHYREDGMNFGVGDESGDVYWADCREANEAETAAAEAARAVRVAAKARRADLAAEQHAVIDGIRKVKNHDALAAPADWELISCSQRAAGSESWQIATDVICYVQSSYDDYHVWRVPYDQDLADTIRRLWPQSK